MPRIGSQQGMQEGSAASGQTHDKDWFGDFLQGNARIQLSIPFQKQTRAQYAQEIGAESNPSDQVKPGLALAGFE
jgi:hypothetical protein